MSKRGRKRELVGGGSVGEGSELFKKKREVQDDKSLKEDGGKEGRESVTGV